jgi:hypothetical protein
MSFERDILNFREKTLKKASYVLRGTALDLFGHVVERTPVGNPSLWLFKAPPGYTGGTARASWQIGINRPKIGVSKTPDKNGSSTINKAEIGLQKASYKDAIYITNNLPYIGELERGWSMQAPKGMVAVTVRAFKRLLKKRAKRHKR